MKAYVTRDSTANLIKKEYDCSLSGCVVKYDYSGTARTYPLICVYCGKVYYPESTYGYPIYSNLTGKKHNEN